MPFIILDCVVHEIFLLLFNIYILFNIVCYKNKKCRNFCNIITAYSATHHVQILSLYCLDRAKIKKSEREKGYCSYLKSIRGRKSTSISGLRLGRLYVVM